MSALVEAPAQAPRQQAIELSGISKTFGTTKVLHGIDLSFTCGEIHGVVGENGAGKSTLFKILSGYHEPDDGGRLTIMGEEVPLPLTPSSSAGRGLAFVHQDLGLGESLSVMDNVCVGAMVTSRLGRIRWRAQAQLVSGLMRELGVDCAPDTPVEQLSQAERAVVAVARGIYARGRERARLLVLDEPTANFSPGERDRLFAALRKVAAQGTAVVFCTHRLDEILTLTDRVTVLRDGRVVRRAATSEIADEADLVRSILGRDLSSFYPDHSSHAGRAVALRVSGLAGGYVHDVSFDVHAGEVLGLTGLAGSGHELVPHLLVGDPKPRAGTVEIGGEELRKPSPRRAVAAGLGFLPADRKRDSGLLDATLRENLTLVSLDRYTSHGRLRHRAERDAVRTELERYDVRPRGDTERLLGSLSGGNQQKVLLAKWMARTDLRCLMLHEPTQGVDVGAKQFILEHVEELTRRGIAVLLVSSEPEEMSHLCDRVVVMRDGVARIELTRPSAAAIAEQCFLA